MPYWVESKGKKFWRGRAVVKGKAKAKNFDNKADAVKWENETRLAMIKELDPERYEKIMRSPTGHPGTLKTTGRIAVFNPESGKNEFEHRLIYEAAYGPIPDGAIIHHKNGDPTDNRLENLIMFKNNAEHLKYHAMERRRKRAMDRRGFTRRKTSRNDMTYFEVLYYRYGVWYWHGLRVWVDGKRGTVTSANGHYIMVKFDDGPSKPVPCHPTWRVQRDQPKSPPQPVYQRKFLPIVDY